MRCVAVCCSVLQCVAVCCSFLQCIALYFINEAWRTQSEASSHVININESCHTCDQVMSHISTSDVLQCVAVCCSVLQCVAVCCNGTLMPSLPKNCLWLL